MSKNIHRYIDINSLPKRGKLISYKDAIGMSIYFEYKNINGYVYIQDYEALSHMLTIQFPNITDDELYYINTDNFKKVKFGSMIDDSVCYEYKYNIGDKIKNNMGDITILDREIRFVGTKKDKRRFYYIECNLCHHKRWIEATIIHHNNHQFCDKCGIHTYYPEKFIKNMLEQLNIEYIAQFNKKHEEWCSSYFYDIFINKNNKRIILEVNGEQHYTKIWNDSKHTLQDIQQNDYNKKKLALNNNIHNYIVLDCRKSNKEWIKKSVMSSDLPIIFNFQEDDID